MKKHDFMGTHIICEMYNIRDDLLQNREYLLTSLLKGVKESHANCEGILFKQFEPIGLSISCSIKRISRLNSYISRTELYVC